MFKTTSRRTSAIMSAVLLSQATLALAQVNPTRAQWMQADLDKDGQLSKTEAQAAGMKPLLDYFDVFDANKDGKISEIEIANGMKMKRADRSVPMVQTAAPITPSPEKEGMSFKSPDQRRAAMQERFNKADTNKDGGLSKVELQAAGSHRLLENFDVIDSNKDGKITTEEMRAAWGRRQ